MTTDVQREYQHEHFELVRERLKALAVKFWISVPEDPGLAENQDVELLWGYIYGVDLPDRWAAITTTGGGDSRFFIKTWPTFREAEKALVEYVTDDIFAELPVAVCDLHSNVEPWGHLHYVRALIPLFTNTTSDDVRRHYDRIFGIEP